MTQIINRNKHLANLDEGVTMEALFAVLDLLEEVSDLTEVWAAEELILVVEHQHESGTQQHFPTLVKQTVPDSQNSLKMSVFQQL